jgi:DNA polymerase III subunit beta
MSTFTVAKSTLQSKINLCNQICTRKDPVEVYTHTKIEVKAGILFISCLNSSLFYQTSITLESSTTDCVFVIKTDMFASAVDLLDNATIELRFDSEKQSLLVKGNKAKHNLRTNNRLVDDFISPVPSDDSVRATVEMSSKDFENAVQKAFVAVGTPKNTYQPEFCNICFSINDETSKLSIVSTDRYRVSRLVPAINSLTMNKENANYKAGQTNFLLLPKNLKLALSSIDSAEAIKLSFENDFAWIKAGSTELTMSYGQGNYPDYNKIIPESFACNFILDPKEMLSGLKQVSLIGNLDAVNRKVKLFVNPEVNEIKLVTENSDGESSESIVKIEKYEGVNDSWEQAFNSGYISDYLNITDASKLLWESNPGKPSILSPENAKESELYLVSGLK